MRCLLADNESNVLFALRVLLVRQPDIQIVGEAGDADTLLAKLATTNPNIVITDWLLPGLADIGSIPALRKTVPNLFIIAISGRPELEQAALAAGADAFVSKIDPPQRLLAAIKRGEQAIVVPTKAGTHTCT